ncbi:MAG TPA: YtcA family lipoprotein [Candidatus Acidoferrales bacterium]|nr:YtcA family lipoprotein [Candidatus Acidoferrales bacterium]
MNLIKPNKIRAAVGGRFISRMLWQTAAGMNLILLTGCRGAPSINVLGSFFPGWMFCMAIGVVGVLLLRLVFIKINIEPHLPWRVPVYICLWILITLLSWLLFFRN